MPPPGKYLLHILVYFWKEAPECQGNRLKSRLATKIVVWAPTSLATSQRETCRGSRVSTSESGSVLFPCYHFHAQSNQKGQKWDDPLFLSGQWHMLRPCSFLFFQLARFLGSFSLEKWTKCGTGEYYTVANPQTCISSYLHRSHQAIGQLSQSIWNMSLEIFSCVYTSLAFAF